MNTQVRDFRPFPLGINFNIAVVLHAGEAIAAARVGMCRGAPLAGGGGPGSAPRRQLRPCDAPEMSVRRFFCRDSFAAGTWEDAATVLPCPV